ncbi:MAG: hypothetical protein E7362_03200 [Clostridiales bacterium]|nr:hypothetical protein [Clostridiales bacterium]
MKKHNLVASLEYGKILSLFAKLLFYIIMFISVILSIVFVFVFCFNNQEGYIAGILVCVVWAVLSLLFIVRDNKILKIYKQCLNDAVELEAESTITDRAYESIRTFLKVRISVKFYYKNKKIIKKSGTLGYAQIFDGSKRAGYNIVFNKYGDRNIKILYSEKYDHVFILKD